MKHPKGILEDVIDALEGTDHEHLAADLEQAWEQLPNSPVEISDEETVVYARISDGFDSAEEALCFMIRELTNELAHEVEALDPEHKFPGDEARENSLEDLRAKLFEISNVAAKDHILFSEDKMPRNHVAVQRIIDRSDDNCCDDSS